VARKRTSSKRTPPRDKAMIDVTVVLLDDGYASTAVAPIEIFHSAGLLWNMLQGEPQRPRFHVRVASMSGRGVSSTCAMALKPSCSIRDVKQTDIIVIPACGMDVQSQAARHRPLIRWLRRSHARGTNIAGICTGVAFLAEAGLLDGKQATTHWAVADLFRQRYPKVRWEPEQFVTEDGRVFCGGGLYSSVDLSLYLVEKFCGREVALQCAKSLLVNMPRSRQSGYSVLPLSRQHSDDRIRQVEAFLQENFDRDVSIAGLADRIGMGPRNFIRRFKAATGCLPGAYIQKLRVTAARELLEHGAESIQTVCSKSGYEDLAFFRSLFKRHTGMTPAEYRKRFAQTDFYRSEPGDRKTMN
jgi:transcriptional regulator GlxA family with amidase domain